MEIPEPTEVIGRLERLPGLAAVIEALGPGFEPSVLVAGGAVRDVLSGRAPADVDLVVEGTPAAVAERLGGELRTYDRFATARVTLGGLRYDIARSRSETYPRPGALPLIAPAAIEQDLRRRDFTVNAIAAGLTGARRGQLIAAPQALADLAGRRLRILHERSFVEDPTRLLRLARYRARLGYEIEPETHARADAAVAAGALGTVSGARLGQELRLLAREPDPVTSFLAVAELGLDRAIDPELGLDDPALAQRALELLPSDARSDRLVLALAAWGVDPVRLGPLLEHLDFTAEDRDGIVAIVAGAGAVAERLGDAERPSQIAAAVGAGSVELVALAGALGPAGPAREWLSRLRLITLQINGSDLLAAGVPRGPAVGAGLRAARNAALDGRAPGRAEQLAEAVRAVRGTG